MKSIRIEKQLNHRCPFCHSSINDRPGSLNVCACGTIYHEECRKSLKECSGCVGYTTSNNKGPDKSSYPSSGSREIVRLTLQAIKAEKHYEEALAIAKHNAKGKIWLVGGKVYRHLAAIMGYPTNDGHEMRISPYKCDYDFLIEKIRWWVGVPKLVQISRTIYLDHYDDPCTPYKVYTNPFLKRKKYKAYRFIRIEKHQTLDYADFQVDLLPLNKLPTIKKLMLPYTLQGYFDSVPLNIQAIALHLNSSDETYMYGSCGYYAMYGRRIVAVNNINALIWAAQKHDIHPNEYIKRKADSLGFEYKLLEGMQAELAEYAMESKEKESAWWGWAGAREMPSCCKLVPTMTKTSN